MTPGVGRGRVGQLNMGVGPESSDAHLGARVILSSRRAPEEGTEAGSGQHGEFGGVFTTGPYPPVVRNAGRTLRDGEDPASRCFALGSPSRTRIAVWAIRYQVDRSVYFRGGRNDFCRTTPTFLMDPSHRADFLGLVRPAGGGAVLRRRRHVRDPVPAQHGGGSRDVGQYPGRLGQMVHPDGGCGPEIHPAGQADRESPRAVHGCL